MLNYYIDGLVQDCSNSIANALELLRSCTKPSIQDSLECTNIHLMKKKFSWIYQSSVSLGQDRICYTLKQVLNECHIEGIRQYDSCDTGQFRQREHRCRIPRTSGSVVPVRQHEWPSSLRGVQVLLAWRPLVSLWRPLVLYVTVLYFHWKSL